MKQLKLTTVLFCLLLATGCSLEKDFVQTDLYFGLSQNNGAIIPDSSWNNFVQNEVAKVFPDGFTEVDAKGKWYDADQHKLTSEPSRMITVVYKPQQIPSLKIDSLRNRYKNLFSQQSVLRVDKKAGISF